MRRIFILVLTIGLCNGVSEIAECSARGRFPNNEVEDCRGYTICLLGGASFIQYKLACPAGFVYSHLEQQCTNATDYQCLPNFNCTNVGNFFYAAVKDCSFFVTCVNGTSDLVTARLIDCPPKMIFNPNESICVNETDYNCNVNITGLSGVVISNGNNINISRNISISGAVSLYSSYALIFYLITFVLL